MRRISTVFVLLCAVAVPSVLGGPGALAAQPEPSERPPVPAGWSVVKGNEIKGAEFARTGKIRFIRSAANDRYVAAELGRKGANYGMLRARATKPRAWERFNLLWDDRSRAYVLRSRANDRYVTADLARRGETYGVLRASATQIGDRELFTLYRNVRTGKYSLLSNANSRWVSAELEYDGRKDGMLRARARKIGDWEQFTFS